MNYIIEMNCFHEISRVRDVTVSEQVLWHALMDYCNSIGWEKKFQISLCALKTYTRLSQNAIVKARARLVERGFIRYTSNGTHTTEYELFSLTNKVPKHSKFYSDKDCDKDCGKDCGKADNINNINNINNKKIKTETEIKTKIISFSDMIDGYTPDLSLRIALSRFIEFRHSAGSPFTRSSLRLFLNELKNFGNDEKKAEAVNRSLKNGWKSLVWDPPLPDKPKVRETRFTNFNNRIFDFRQIEHRSLYRA